MRCRGVSVTSREGQLLSQKPHSMQRLTRSEAAGLGLRNLMWASGSRLRITPGLRTKVGSKRPLSVHMSSVALVPHSISTNGATLRPVPCSALRLPLCLVATMWHISSIMSRNRCTSSGVRKPWLNTRCRLPSSACPKHDASS